MRSSGTGVRFHLCKAGHCRHPEIVTLRGGSLFPCEFPSLFGLIVHPRAGLFLFDTGYHPLYNELRRNFPEGLYPRFLPAAIAAGDTAAEQLRRRGYSPDDVAGVVISHFHGDHIAGLRDFRRARFYTRKSAWEAVAGKAHWRNLTNGFLSPLLPDDFLERLDFIDEGRLSARAETLGLGPGWDLLGDGSLSAIPLPGHMPGQLGLYFEEDGRETFLIADAAWSSKAIRELRPPSFLALAIMEDGEKYLETLQALHELHRRNKDLRLIPSHCAETFAACKDAP
jgi:glyoxylase-like metal-dependent hydrolase (beta-lactamase superfamily II)